MPTKSPHDALDQQTRQGEQLGPFARDKVCTASQPVVNVHVPNYFLEVSEV